MTERILPSAVGRFWRSALLLAILGAHVLLLLWLAAPSPAGPIMPRPDAGTTVVSLEEMRGAGIGRKDGGRPPRSIDKTPVASARLPIAPDVDLASFKTDTESGASGGGCSLVDAAADAIASDPAAMAELDALPPDIRSSADAVMLWNGAWLASAGRPAISAGLRRAVERAVTEASPGCRDMAVVGPRFLRVPDAGRTVTIVIGSGIWRWVDLLRECRNPAAVDCTLQDSKKLQQPDINQ